MARCCVQPEASRTVELALVYFDIGSEKETVLEERGTAAELQTYFEAQCEIFLGVGHARNAPPRTAR
jgi:hypothetical protein